MNGSARPLAVVTEALSGFGFELARQCVNNGFDLVIAGDDPKINDAAKRLRGCGQTVEAVKVNLAAARGVDKLYEHLDGRPVDILIANAGGELGGGFLDQELKDIRHVINTSIIGTIYLVQKISRDMQERGTGRILIAGTGTGALPGAYNAVHNGTKAFINSFTFAIGNELRGSGVTVTSLAPGATEAEFFNRAPKSGNKAGWAKLDHVLDFAASGFAAPVTSDSGRESGLHSKIQAALANIAPAERLAEFHAEEALPATGTK